MRVGFHRSITIAIVVGIVAVAACAESTSPVTGGSPLAGLSKGATNDTSPAGPVDAQYLYEPGVVSGTVMAHQAGATGDTLASMPRLAGVEVKVYVGMIDDQGVTPQMLVASTTTGADGRFELPELKAGRYIVTFTPPSDAGYRGVYVVGEIHGNSAKYPWWIVLERA